MEEFIDVSTVRNLVSTSFGQRRTQSLLWPMEFAIVAPFSRLQPPKQAIAQEMRASICSVIVKLLLSSICAIECSKTTICKYLFLFYSLFRPFLVAPFYERKLSVVT